MTALSDLLTQANHQKLSVRAIADRASAAGFELSHGTVARYLNGTHPETPTDEVLRGLAHVFDLDFSHVRQVAGFDGNTELYEVPAEAHRLSRRQRDAVTELIRSMVTRGGEASGDTAPTSDAGGPAGTSNDQGGTVTELPKRPPVESTPEAARTDGAPSQGRARRAQQDEDAQAPDPPGPDDGA